MTAKRQPMAMIDNENLGEFMVNRLEATFASAKTQPLPVKLTAAQNRALKMVHSSKRVACFGRKITVRFATMQSLVKLELIKQPAACLYEITNKGLEALGYDTGGQVNS